MKAALVEKVQPTYFPLAEIRVGRDFFGRILLREGVKQLCSTIASIEKVTE